MNKKLIVEKYIKVAVRKALAEQEAKEKRAVKSMYLVHRFPNLKKIMEDLMSPSFGRFITDVQIVAPKPTTFNVKLINEQEFTIVYDGRKNYTAKVAGKRYNVQQLSELERAQQGIADLLELNYALGEKEGEPAADAGAEAFTAASAPEVPAETPAEEPAPEAPAEETPPPLEA
jgi:hypothetical protein